MSLFVRGDISIYYEQHGKGFPLLLLPPGGRRTTQRQQDDWALGQ
jgi:hypothetical protein